MLAPVATPSPRVPRRLLEAQGDGARVRFDLASPRVGLGSPVSKLVLLFLQVESFVP